jgi:protein-disulfide isomerase
MSRIGFSIFLLLISITANAAIVIGNPKGKITLTAIYDYQCPYCHAMYPIITQLIKTNPNLKVKLMPVSVLNQQSLLEAATAIAVAYYSDKFMEFNQAVMTLPPLSQRELNQLLLGLKLAPSIYHKLQSKIVVQELMESLTIMHKWKLKSVPVFLINKTESKANKPIILTGYQSTEILQEAINKC